MNNTIRAYFNRMAAVWDENIAEKDSAKLKRMARRLNIKPESRVLDIGTGTGVFLPFILAKVGQGGGIVAMDIAGEMLVKARAKGFDGDIAYLLADATGIPLGYGIFDAVVCYSSFPHFQDKPRALAEIYRVIKSGGKLVICHTSSRATINEIHTDIPSVAHDTIPERSQMQAILTEAGFSEIKIADRRTSYLVNARKV